MDASGHSYTTATEFVLENGVVLPEATVQYQTYGVLNDNRDNVLVICHALTGNASVHAWWGGLLGDGLAFDTSRYFVVCANILGSCYGSTSPQSRRRRRRTSRSNDTQEKENDEEQPYGEDFPDVSVQDTVRLQLQFLRDHLRIRSIAAVIGGSFGGMQAVEYMVQCNEELDTAQQQQQKEDDSDSSSDSDDHGDDTPPPFLRSAIPIACGAAHTAWQTGMSHVQRLCIQQCADPRDGLALARQLAMLSYRTPHGYTTKFGRTQQQQATAAQPYGPHAAWAVESYLNYQGTKFLDRFDPITYTKLTEQMDSHDVFRNRDPDVLSRITIPVCVLGIDSDILYPLEEQQALVDAIGHSNAELRVITSPDGHDGFLLEQEQVGGYITDFLREQRRREGEKD